MQPCRGPCQPHDQCMWRTLQHLLMLLASEGAHAERFQVFRRCHLQHQCQLCTSAECLSPPVHLVSPSTLHQLPTLNTKRPPCSDCLGVRGVVTPKKLMCDASSLWYRCSCSGLVSALPARTVLRTSSHAAAAHSDAWRDMSRSNWRYRERTWARWEVGFSMQI